MELSVLHEKFIAAACVPIGPGTYSHGAGDLKLANEILAEHPQLEHGHIVVAAILGVETAVKRWLEKDPGLAITKMGARNWDTLTYLCFSRYLRQDVQRSENMVATAKVLLNAGADANTGFFETEPPPGQQFESVIYGAAGVAAHAGLTKLLLEAGADPNDAETAYHAAEWYDNGAVMELIKSGKLTRRSLATILLRKADVHDLEGTRLLLEAGADPNYASQWHYTPLQQSLRRDNRMAQVDCFLDFGGNMLLQIEGHPKNGLWMAIRRGRKDVLESLMRRGVDIAVDGVEQLLFLCGIGKREDALLLGSQAPALKAALLDKGGMYLGWFAGNNNPAGVACLLELGVPVDAVVEGDPYFEIPTFSTALQVAAWRGWHGVVELLIEWGADVLKADARGRTPLQLAVRACVHSYWTVRRGTDSIAALLAAGADAGDVSLPTGYDAADDLLKSRV